MEGGFRYTQSLILSSPPLTPTVKVYCPAYSGRINPLFSGGLGGLGFGVKVYSPEYSGRIDPLVWG